MGRPVGVSESFNIYIENFTILRSICGVSGEICGKLTIDFRVVLLCSKCDKYTQIFLYIGSKFSCLIKSMSSSLKLDLYQDKPNRAEAGARASSFRSGKICPKIKPTQGPNLPRRWTCQMSYSCPVKIN